MPGVDRLLALVADGQLDAVEAERLIGYLVLAAAGSQGCSRPTGFRRRARLRDLGVAVG